MATWIAHLRIADNLLKYGFELDKALFLLGSLAPDANLIGEQGDEYLSKKESHFRDNDNGHIQPEDFYSRYIHNKAHSSEAYAFLLGYYAHLLADVEWIGNLWRPFKHSYPELGERIEHEPDFAYQFKRLEWFGHDFLYLHQYPDYASFQIIKTIENVPQFLDILSSELLINWLQAEVVTLYKDEENMQQVLNHDFPYAKPLAMQAWLDCTTGTLIELFKGKGVPCPTPHPLWGAYIQPYA